VLDPDEGAAEGFRRHARVQRWPGAPRFAKSTFVLASARAATVEGAIQGASLVEIRCIVFQRGWPLETQRMDLAPALTRFSPGT